MSSTNNPGRFAGLLYVLTSMVGFFAMGYVPSKPIVHRNATTTANNIAASGKACAFEVCHAFGHVAELSRESRVTEAATSSFSESYS
jgi:hypothetical protein